MVDVPDREFVQLSAGSEGVFGVDVDAAVACLGGVEVRNVTYRVRTGDRARADSALTSGPAHRALIESTPVHVVVVQRGHKVFDERCDLEKLRRFLEAFDAQDEEAVRAKRAST